MEVRSSKRDAAVVLEVSGILDTPAARELEREAQAALAGENRHIVVDLSGAELLTSACIRVLVTLNKRLAAAGGALWLCALNDHVTEVFTVAGIAVHFQTAATQAEALAKCDGARRGSREPLRMSALAQRVLTSLGRGLPDVRVPPLSAASGAPPSALARLARRALER